MFWFWFGLVEQSTDEVRRGPVRSQLRVDGPGPSRKTLTAASRVERGEVFDDDLPSQLPPVPPGGEIVGLDIQTGDGLRETVVKLESYLSPLQLATFYTDALVDDWIIYRDDLSGNAGWSGVFMQIGDIERRMGVFTAAQRWSDLKEAPVATSISIILVEEIEVE